MNASRFSIELWSQKSHCHTCETPLGMLYLVKKFFYKVKSVIKTLQDLVKKQQEVGLQEGSNQPTKTIIWPPKEPIYKRHQPHLKDIHPTLKKFDQGKKEEQNRGKEVRRRKTKFWICFGLYLFTCARSRVSSCYI